MATANLRAKISLNSSAFTKGIASAKAAAQSLANVISKVAKTALFLGSAFTGIGLLGLAKFIKRSLDLSGALDRNGFSLTKVSKGLKNMGTGLIQGLSPTISKAFDFLDTIDFKAVGLELGRSLQIGINVLYNAFKEGRIGELVSTALQTGIFTGLDFLIKGFRAAANFLQEAMGQAMAVLANASFWKFMQEGLIGVFSTAAASLLDAFSEPIRAIQAGLTFAFEHAAKFLGNALGPIIKPVLSLFGSAGKAASEEIDMMATSQPRDFSEIFKIQKANLFGVTKEDFKGVAGASFGKARETATQAFSPISFDALKETITKAFSGETIFGGKAAEAQSKLAELFTQLSPAIGPETRGRPTHVQGIATDALARIGGFVGGGAGSAISFARKTSDNTSLMVKSLDGILMNMSRKLGGNVPVWGE